MPRFFIQIQESNPVITGSDARHISGALRMKKGDGLVVCDENGIEHECVITSVSNERIELEVLNKTLCTSEPDVKVRLLQGLPKGDKMEQIIQKSVELGVDEIVPVLCERSISRPEKAGFNKKLERWNKIALEACKQCGRGKVVKVSPLTAFEQAVSQPAQKSIFFYESGGVPLAGEINSDMKSINIFIGPEGGFSDNEFRLAERHGAAVCTLGKRILRTETAGVAALSAIMFTLGEMG